MNPAKQTIPVLLFIVLFGCSRGIEVPENKVAVVYNGPQQIEDEVLKTGSHTIRFFSEVSLYDVREQQQEFKFDILFNDASAADIDFTISYVAKVDELARICQKYQQRVDQNSISDIVWSEARSQVRKLLIDHDKNELDEKLIFSMVENSFRNQDPVSGIIDLKSFSPGKVKFGK